MRYRFIEDHRADYPVTLLCRVMQPARSGYYAWRNEPLSLRKVADLVLLQHIEDIFEEGRQTYESTRSQSIPADAGRRPQAKNQTALSGHHDRQQASVAGGSEPVGSGFHGRRPHLAVGPAACSASWSSTPCR